MYANACSNVCVVGGYSHEFQAKVGVNHSSSVIPLFFIIMVDILSREFHSGVPWSDPDSLEGCVRRLLIWQGAMKKGLNGLKVNAGYTKLMICCTGHDLPQNT